MCVAYKIHNQTLETYGELKSKIKSCNPTIDMEKIKLFYDNVIDAYNFFLKEDSDCLCQIDPDKVGEALGMKHKPSDDYMSLIFTKDNK